MAFPWLFHGPLLSRKLVCAFFDFLVAFSWRCRGSRFEQISHVLALEKSSERLWEFQAGGRSKQLREARSGDPRLVNFGAISQEDGGSGHS